MSASGPSGPLVLFSATGEECNRTFCSDHGNCNFEHHRPVCMCGKLIDCLPLTSSLTVCILKPQKPLLLQIAKIQMKC